MSLFGHKFVNTFVYEPGGSSIEELFRSYKDYHTGDENNQPKHVGFHAFSDIAKLMTKKGESKAGISQYYINFRYVTHVFDPMMN